MSAGQTVEIQFAQSVSQSFLGINLKCASCHDSFIDRWKLDEAYGLAAIYSNRELDIHRCDKPVGRKAAAAWLFPELGQVDPQAPQPERLKQLALLMTHPENGRFTRTIVNRIWHRLMGRGIVHPVDAMQTEPWNADLLDYLANHLAENGYDLKKTIELIATSQAYQSKAQVMAKGTDDHGYVYAGPRAKRMTAEQFVDAVWQLTGAAPPKFDAPVMRGKVDPAAAGKFKPVAQWIWGDSAKDGKLPPADEKIALRKEINLAREVEHASAVITCDNAYELYVNNRRVSQGENWQNLTSVLLTGALKQGANTIVVIATNGGIGPNAAGLYFEPACGLRMAAEVIVASDATWQWSGKLPTMKEGRMSDVANADWKPATVVRALPPWSKAVDAKVPAMLRPGCGERPAHGPRVAGEERFSHAVAGPAESRPDRLDAAQRSDHAGSDRPLERAGAGRRPRKGREEARGRELAERLMPSLVTSSGPPCHATRPRTNWRPCARRWVTSSRSRACRMRCGPYA